MVKAKEPRTVTRRERVDALVTAAGSHDGPAFRSELNSVVNAGELAMVVAALAGQLYDLRAALKAIASQAAALVEVRS